MTKLRQKMLEDMQLRGLRPETQKAYVGAVKLLAEHYNRRPDQITEAELRGYLLYLRNEKGVSNSTFKPIWDMPRSKQPQSTCT